MGARKKSGGDKRGVFSDDLRARTDAQLVDLLLARPDLARPPSSDIPTLASRASNPASVARALDTLDGRALTALQALVVADGDIDDAAGLCGVDRAEFTAVAEHLWRLALVWQAGARYRFSGTTVQALGPYVAGLAPSAGTTPPHDARDIEALLRDITPEARHLLESMTWGPPVGELTAEAPHELRRAVDSLVTRGLLDPVSGTRVQLPRHVALVLRGGRIAPGTPLSPPVPRLTPVTDAARASTLAAVNGLLERVDELGHHLGAEPPKVLRADALGVRELRRIATHLDLERDDAIILLELAWAAGLVGTVEIGGSRSDDLVYAPTQAFDAWRRLDAPLRWASLALAWFGTDRAPGLIGDTPPSAGSKSTVIPPAVFGRTASSAMVRAVRHGVLHVLAGLRAEHGDVSLRSDDLLSLVTWRQPRRDPAILRDGVSMAVREAAALGLVSVDTGVSADLGDTAGVLRNVAITDAGAALWRAWRSNPGDTSAETLSHPDEQDPPELRDAADTLAGLESALPRAAHELLLQADLTAVVPGRLDGSLADLLRSSADLESRGGATVFRFSADSVRRHLDTGATADELLATLERLAPAGVPQPLEYLVRDVSRRHGRLRVGSLSTFIVSDDVSALDAAEHDKAVRDLHLRRLAPTVLASPAAKRTVVATLRKAGHAPVAEGAGGGVEADGPKAVRANDARLGHSWSPSSRLYAAQVTSEDAMRAVIALRLGDEHLSRRENADGNSPRISATDPTVTLDVLREAAATATPVWIGLAAGDGSTSRLLFHPAHVEAGRVRGTVEGSDEQRTFSVHRLIGAIPATRE